MSPSSLCCMSALHQPLKEISDPSAAECSIIFPGLLLNLPVCHLSQSESLHKLYQRLIQRKPPQNESGEIIIQNMSRHVSCAAQTESFTNIFCGFDSGRQLLHFMCCHLILKIGNRNTFWTSL